MLRLGSAGGVGVSGGLGGADTSPRGLKIFFNGFIRNSFSLSLFTGLFRPGRDGVSVPGLDRFRLCRPSVPAAGAAVRAEGRLSLQILLAAGAAALPRFPVFPILKDIGQAEDGEGDAQGQEQQAP